MQEEKALFLSLQQLQHDQKAQEIWQEGTMQNSPS